MTHGSLFSGIGGFDLAAQWMGWQNIFHCEINPFCQKILNHYWPNAESYTDIKQTDFSIYRGKIDVLSGGFPCQPFSTAGRRKGAEDDRYLWPEMLRAIDEIRPTWVIGENVAGLSSMVQPEAHKTRVESQINLQGEADQETVLEYQQYVIETVCSDLERLGYTVQPVVIPACAVGAPHKRDRIWFIAHASSMQPQRIRRFGKLESSTRTSKTIWEEWERLRNAIRYSGQNLYASDPNQQGLQIERLAVGPQSPGREKQDRFVKQHSSYDWRTLPTERWENFPTQSPVCSRDDGIPFKLDGITFPKWRAESIKAYGNAVVPQVVFEIFKAIKATA